MTIRFNCQQCGVGVKAPVDSIGSQLPCPKCGVTVVVPNVSDASNASDGDSQDMSDEASQFANLAAAIDSDTRPAAPPQSQVSPRPSAPNASAPHTAQPQGPNPFQSPVGGQSTVGIERVGTGQVRIVDIRLTFGTVFRLVFQLWLAALVFGFALWVIMAMVALLLALVGGGLSLSF